MGKAIKNNPQFFGVHFDLEPHEPIFYDFYSSLRAYTEKPITAAVSHWDEQVFSYCDLTVLMGYDWADSPATFANNAENKIPSFIREAHNKEAKILVGVPAIATHIEMEGYSEICSDSLTKTGYQMHEFVKASMTTIKKTLDYNTDAYLGASVWALHEQDGLHSHNGKKWHYPTRISAETWKLLRNFPASHSPEIS